MFDLLTAWGKQIGCDVIQPLVMFDMGKITGLHLFLWEYFCTTIGLVTLLYGLFHSQGWWCQGGEYLLTVSV